MTQHVGKLFFLFFIFYFSYSNCNAQWYDPEKVNKKAGDYYAQAYQNAQDEKYTEAINNVKKSIAIEPKFVDAYLTLAGIFANMKKYDSSVFNFEKAFQLDSVYSHDYYLPYSISLAGLGKFNNALSAVNLFLASPKLNEKSIKAGNYRKSVYQFALDFEKKHPQNNYIFSPKNLGDSINTVHSEYYPSIPIDGSKMVFTRRIDADEDFYESNNSNKKWGMASPLPGKVNTTFNEGAQNISQDGEWIVFAGCNYPEGQGGCDIYISHKTKNGWSEAENLGPFVNTDYWESAPSISPDKKDIYFSSNRPDGFGGRDIWVTHRMPNGKWGRPQNLGDSINTAGDEACSFIYADNQTLFFNSNGHQGYGQADLFFSKKINDSTWSKAQNLGYPINTIDEEGSLIVAADGKTAYYASDRSDSRGGLDIYSFELRNDIRPPQTLWVKGKVFDATTKQGLPSTIELADLSTKQTISKVQTDEEGNYLTTLPIGKNYAFDVTRKGYLFYSENFNLTEIDSSFTADIALQPIVAGAKIVLKNIFFDTKKTALKPASMVELDKVIQLMTDNPKLIISITGYTDNIGKITDNIILSKGRANAVVSYLLASKKIAKTRLQSNGLGAAKPIADNATEKGRAANRRTELSVVSN